MRKSLLLLLLITFHVVGFTQSFPGYNSGNYTGVNGVFFNPANVADSRYRWDFNLFGLNATVGTTGTTFSLKNIGTAFDGSIDSILFGNTGKTVSAMANIDVFGPSVMFNVSKKTSFALTTRVRTLANIQNIDGKLVQSVQDKLDDDFPITLSSDNNQKININAWGDFGATLGRVLYDQRSHFLKAGVTVKYLAGVANTYLNIASFKGTAKQDNLLETYITDATGKVGIGISGVDIDNFDAQDMLKFKSTGIGTDIGLIYEYRPKESNRYKVKVGVSLLDMGSIKYTPDPTKTGAYDINIPDGNKWYPKELGDSSISGIKTYLDNKNEFFTNTTTSVGEYKVPLPTTLLLNVDYNIHRGFYIGLSGHLNAAKTDNKYGSFYYNSFTLTPRYEGKKFGLYVPLNYNDLTNVNAGVSLRMGPLYLGSGSILTALFDKSKQADVHFGMRFGVVKKDVRKVKVIEKTTVTIVEKQSKKTKEQKVAADTAVAVPPVVAVPEPPKDSDGDGIFDADDKCPAVSGTFKYNGCPVPDTDGDGVNDEMDSCINVPGLVKYNGCPVPDTDGDGINDELDRCPNQAGLERYNGCPIPDTDGDGVDDEKDKCVKVAGSDKYEGCPVPDTDGDGLNDDDDKCPTVAGSKTNFGCPEIKKDVVKKVNLAAKGLQFQTGKAVILKKSFVQLDNVVKILKASPALKLTIEGHTDNVGKEEKNQALSEARAAAAKAYFVKKGIDEQRITAIGYGASKPLVPNTTAANKLKNRRVVFTISN